ncbi:MAG: DUF3261 domain-containing protein [Moraxellaceae bacterium]|nr:DUF3261 domain-containing protein [Moraxellaceae bacterium]
MRLAPTLVARLVAHLLGCLLLVGLLAACAPAGDTPLLRIPVSALGERTLSQQVSITRGDTTRSFEAVVEIDASRLRLVASAVGLRLLALDYDGERLVISDNRLPEGLPPAWIMNDMLYALTPLEVLRKALPAGWQVVDEEGSRVLLKDGQPAIDIEYGPGAPWNGSLRVQQRLGGYTLDIATAEVQ